MDTCEQIEFNQLRSFEVPIEELSWDHNGLLHHLTIRKPLWRFNKNIL